MTTEEIKVERKNFIIESIVEFLLLLCVCCSCLILCFLFGLYVAGAVKLFLIGWNLVG